MSLRQVKTWVCIFKKAKTVHGDKQPPGAPHTVLTDAKITDIITTCNYNRLTYNINEITKLSWNFIRDIIVNFKETLWLPKMLVQY